ncbi:MAG: hypothetical protein VCB07_05050 [Gammaproteobacteria bacterium]
MAKNLKLKPIAAALGTTFAVTLAASPLANAAQNPFSVTAFDTGYMVAGEEGKCGEGRCGEGKCGEGKTKNEEMSKDEAGAKEKAMEEKAEGGEPKCGEGKCGGDK